MRRALVDAQAIADVAGYVNQIGIRATPDVGAGRSGAAAEGDAKRAIPQLAGQYYGVIHE